MTYYQIVGLTYLMQRAIKSNYISSVIKQKGESQNGGNKKIKDT